MKAKISVIAFLTALICITKAQAAQVLLEDYINSVVKISGQSSQDVNVLILKPGITLNDAESDTSAVKFMGHIPASPNGNYSQLIKIEPGGDIGEYSVYVSENGGDSICHALFISDTTEKTEKAAALAASLLTGSDSEIATSIALSKNVLALNIPLFEGLSLNETARSLRQYYNGAPPSFDDVNVDSPENIAELIEFQRVIKTFALLSAYNQGLGEKTFEGTGGFSHLELLGLSTLHSEKDVTAYELYENSLSAAGKSAVQSALLSKNVQSIESFQRLFTELTMLYGISLSKYDGYGHISDFITRNNVRYAMNITGSTPLETYFSIGDKGIVNMTIRRNSAGLTLANYKSEIERYAIESLTPTVNPVTPGGSGGGGGGSGGGNFSVDGTAISAAQNDKHDEGNGDEFSDVECVPWAKEAINALSAKGIINGVGSGLFQPNDPLTREQAVKIICLAFEIPMGEYSASESLRFADVEVDEWYAPYVYSAKSVGILNGISETEFGVGVNIKRQDFAVIIHRVLKPTTENPGTLFADHHDIPTYAKEAVSYLKSKAVINGFEDGSFGGELDITRAQAAKIIHSVMDIRG